MMGLAVLPPELYLVILITDVEVPTPFGDNVPSQVVPDLSARVSPGLKVSLLTSAIEHQGSLMVPEPGHA